MEKETKGNIIQLLGNLISSIKDGSVEIIGIMVSYGATYKEGKGGGSIITYSGNNEMHIYYDRRFYG